MSWALITGGSGGIGLELARLAAADGYDLLLVARDGDGLQVAAAELSKVGVTVDTLALDLGLPGAAAKVYEWVGSREIAILVNNAGFATHGALADTELATLTSEIGVNVTTLTGLTRLLVPSMITRQAGRILNVASVAAFAPGPMMAVYYATKSYVLSLSVSLANELGGTGVTVTALCPGPTKTGFAARAAVEHTHAFSGRLMDAAVVARIGYAGMRRGKAIVVPGVRSRIQTWLVRLVSRPLAAKIVRRVQE